MSELPRVTHILEAVGLGPDLSGVPATLLEIGRRRGTAVHALIEAEVYGYPPEDKDAELYAPFLLAYRTFVREAQYKTEQTERLVTHAAWGYCGHLDSLGWFMGTQRAIVDWKSGEPPDLKAANYQLAAYRRAWNEEHPQEPVDCIGVVNLRDDGTYRWH
mgnify:FL=1